MDLDHFRAILDAEGVDVWGVIDAAITVASLDYVDEWKKRRDGIVERVYVATLDSKRCRKCDADLCIPNGREINDTSKKDHNPTPVPAPPTKRAVSPPSPQSDGEKDEEGDDLDPYGGLFDVEQKKILEIKEQLEDSHQSEDALIESLQCLADMDITFQALKETDIGRNVNQFRKHSSIDVRRLVKLLVRKWKDKIDEWVKNQPGEQGSSALVDDGDSPQLKNIQNGSHQVPDFANSPNLRTGSSGSERNSSEPEPKPKAIPRKATPPKRAHASHSAFPHPPPNRQREHIDGNMEAERLASARRRLQESYKEAENAKRQRTIQVMDIHDLPKPKNTFFSKNKGGAFGSHGRHR